MDFEKQAENKFSYDYKIPTQLFIILEKMDVAVFSSETLTPNHYIIYLNKNDFLLLNGILKNEFFLSKSILVENSAVDTLNYNNFTELTTIVSINRILPYYIYYLYSIKTKLTIILYNEDNKSIESVDTIYKNANWLERETSEMYGIYYKNKKDCRKLLLDYTKDENPLLKDYPTEGYNDIFYNFFEDQVIFDSANVVEL